MQISVPGATRHERPRDSALGTFDRVMHAIAALFKRDDDRSLVNAKFTDAFERELAERAFRRLA
jgi:sulfatase maturation enzyme AslB (radical SAM superfamily)